MKYYLMLTVKGIHKIQEETFDTFADAKDAGETAIQASLVSGY